MTVELDPFKTLNRSMSNEITGFTLNSTGITNFDLQLCSNGFSFNEFIFFQAELPNNMEFLQEQDQQFMFRSNLQSEF